MKHVSDHISALFLISITVPLRVRMFKQRDSSDK